MPPLNALRRRGAAEPPTPDLFEQAHVVNTPADATEEVYVTLDRFDTNQPVGPVQGWAVHPETAWPHAGAECLVLTVAGAWWFVGWEPV